MKWNTIKPEDLTNIPGIYRWNVTDLEGKVVCRYIGEAVRLRERIRFYIKDYSIKHRQKYGGNGHKDTDVRVKDTLKSLEDQGYIVELQILEFETYQGVTPEMLKDAKIFRLAIESKLIVESLLDGIKMLNKQIPEECKFQLSC